MSEQLPPSGEEDIDESGRNPTQQRIDSDGPDETPLDTEWEPEGDEE